jgi:hypothetical protein
MTKAKEEQTIQWPKQKKNRQYNGQSKRRTDNTMAKTKEEQTMQWPKQKGQIGKQIFVIYDYFFVENDDFAKYIL